MRADIIISPASVNMNMPTATYQQHPSNKHIHHTIHVGLRMYLYLYIWNIFEIQSRLFASSFIEIDQEIPLATV